jgi:6-pyruvoyl-tetrahydropterin synthase
MQYVVEVEQAFTALQGLRSPLLRARGMSPSAPKEGFAVVLKVGITFDESQLTARGWFVDTDAVQEQLAEICAHLESDKWTTLFDFRPTLEAVARWAFKQLAPQLEQLAYLELRNDTIGTTTRYTTE